MNKDDYIMVSFATKDGKYDIFGKRWEKNMTDLNIPFDIEYIDPIKPSKHNERLLSYKRQKKDAGRTRGKFLYNKLKQYNKTIIWMDCDDGFIEKPILPKDEYDVGFVDGEIKSLQIMARLLVLKPTENCYHFLNVWDYLNSWPELEPIGGSHLRLHFARYICFKKNGKNPMGFKDKNLTDVFLPYLKIDMHR